MVVNGQINLLTQKFGPFFNNSVELTLSLHNDNKKPEDVAKFTLNVEVRKLKADASLKHMNLCGQFGMSDKKWNHNFCESQYPVLIEFYLVIELKETEKGLTTFEFPVNLLKFDTLMTINMQYLSKQYQRHYVVNSKGKI